MTSKPEFRVLSGSPSERDLAAIRAAILEVWRDEQVRAARSAGADPWVLAGRVEALGSGSDALRLRAGRSSWRLSGRVAARVESVLTHGRGDAK